MTEPRPADVPAAPRKPSFWRSMRMVAWGFFGVRKNSAYQEDLTQLNPLHVILAAITAVLVFIAVLLAVVKWVVATA